MKKDSPSEEKSQAKETLPFIAIPPKAIPVLCRIKKSESDVYLVLAKYANYNSGYSYPAVDTISKESGHSRNSVCSATRRLEEYGLIKKKRIAMSGKHRIRYEVFRDPKINLHMVTWRKDTCKREKDKKTGKFRVGTSTRYLHKGTSTRYLHKGTSRKDSKESERELKRLALEPTTISSPRKKQKIKKAKKPKVPAGEKDWKAVFGKKPAGKTGGTLKHLKDRLDKIKSDRDEWEKKNPGKKDRLFEEGIKWLNDEIAAHKN